MNSNESNSQNDQFNTNLQFTNTFPKVISSNSKLILKPKPVILSMRNTKQKIISNVHFRSTLEKIKVKRLDEIQDGAKNEQQQNQQMFVSLVKVPKLNNEYYPKQASKEQILFKISAFKQSCTLDKAQNWVCSRMSIKSFSVSQNPFYFGCPENEGQKLG